MEWNPCLPRVAPDLPSFICYLGLKQWNTPVVKLYLKIKNSAWPELDGPDSASTVFAEYVEVKLESCKRNLVIEGTRMKK